MIRAEVATRGERMNLAELLREVDAIAQTGGEPARVEALARETHALADMVGWATGPIDPQGQWLERLAGLQADLRQRHDQAREPLLALLHDSLTELGRAIARHDEDLEAKRNTDDEDEDIA